MNDYYNTDNYRKLREKTNGNSDAVLMSGIVWRNIFETVRNETNGVGRKGDCFASGGKSKYKVMRCKTIWPSWVPEIGEHSIENIFGVRKGKVGARYIRTTWILKEIHNLFASVMLISSARKYSHMEGPWGDWFYASSLGPSFTSGTTKMGLPWWLRQ